MGRQGFEIDLSRSLELKAVDVKVHEAMQRSASIRPGNGAAAGFYTVAHRQAAITVQVAFRFRLRQSKWNTLIEELHKKNLLDDMEIERARVSPPNVNACTARCPANFYFYLWHSVGSNILSAGRHDPMLMHAPQKFVVFFYRGLFVGTSCQQFGKTQG